MQVKGPGDVSVTCETCEDFASLILYFQMLPSEKNNVVGVDLLYDGQLSSILTANWTTMKLQSVIWWCDLLHLTNLKGCRRFGL
jgi:hypothetical protein